MRIFGCPSLEQVHDKLKEPAHHLRYKLNGSVCTALLRKADNQANSHESIRPQLMGLLPDRAGIGFHRDICAFKRHSNQILQ